MYTLKSILESPRLPSVPAVAVRLLELVNNEDAGIRDIIQLVQADPALTARIVQAANVSTLGLKRQVSSLDLAVALLGKTIVTSLALNFSLVPKSRLTPACRAAFEDYWLRSVIQASAARLLAPHVAGATADELFIVGLLCDLGRLAMLSTMQEEYCQILESARTNGLGLPENESRCLGFNHVEVGTELARIWSLPTGVCEAIRIHHRPPVSISSAEPLQACQLVAIASSVATQILMSEGNGVTLGDLQQFCRVFFHLDQTAVCDFLRGLRQEVDRVGPVLSADPAQLADTDAILWQANNQLLKLTLAAQATVDQTLAENEELRAQNEWLKYETADLRQVAMRDALTQLPNVHVLNELLPREVARCQRQQTPLGILFCDIDHFKSVNDNYGHAAGDAVLAQAARLLEESLRKSDVVVRYGGEEFVLVAPGADLAALKMVAERVRRNIEQAPIQVEDLSLSVTISIGGISLIPPQTEADANSFARSMLLAADRALYYCKENGRNCCHIVEDLSDGPGLLAARQQRIRCLARL